MKKILSKLIRDEKGQALIVVLVLLLLGGLIIAPLTAHMSTGLVAFRAKEERTYELYAADAGVQDAIYKIINDVPYVPETTGDLWAYNLGEVYGEYPNDKDVDVVIEMGWDTLDFIETLLDRKFFGGEMPQEDWLLVYRSPEPGVFEIEIVYQGNAGTMKIPMIGAWLIGTYTLNGPATGITDEFPNYTKPPKEISFRDGTAFIWEWPPGKDYRPVFKKGDPPKTLTFNFTPDKKPSFALAWVEGLPNSVYISYGGNYDALKVTATATDRDTLKRTVVTAYIAREGEEAPYVVSILSWEISQQ